jgi:ABC-type cobalamin/Fe3+-siderophores transport system ATPase subunit
MKIKNIRLQRFRQFGDTTFEVGPFNLLVGPNNCGKTSLLHAIRAFFLLMHGHVRFEGEPPKANYHRRFLSSAEEIAPTPDIRELWNNQEAGKPLSISVTFADDVTFSVVLRQQFGQIHVSTEELPPNLTSAKVTKYLGTQVAFIPGLVGVLVSEPYATRARRNALATQGRYSEIFRSSLQQLKTKDAALLATINDWLTGLFGVTVSTVEFDSEADEFVTVRYTQGEGEFDVVSSGAGLQQVIQMLTYLYLSQPRVLLIDEPDAHLHSKLQARLGELFRRVAQDLDAQIFLSTHSLDLIDTFSTNEVLVIDSSKKLVGPIGKNAELVSTLVDANVVDVSALSRLLSSRRLVVIEDADQTILKAIDKAVGSPLFSPKSSSYVLPAKGSGNFRAIAELGKVLAGLTGTRFDLTFVQDRDGMPDFIVNSFLASQKADGVRAHLLDRHEIENYLLEPALIERAAKALGIRITEAQARTAVLESVGNVKAKARRQSVEIGKQINRHLSTQERWKESDLEEEVYKWFDALDLTSLDTIQRVFPGKEMLAETLKTLNEGNSKSLTRGHLVAAIDAELVAADIRDLLTKAGEGTTGKPTPGRDREGRTNPSRRRRTRTRRA